MVILPTLFRPTDFFNSVTRLFSGREVVISAKSGITRKRIPGVTGFSFFKPILDRSVNVYGFTFGQRDNGFFVRALSSRNESGFGAPVFHFSDGDKCIHTIDIYTKHGFYGVFNLDLICTLVYDKTIDSFLIEFCKLLVDYRFLKDWHFNLKLFVKFLLHLPRK